MKNGKFAGRASIKGQVRSTMAEVLGGTLQDQNDDVPLSDVPNIRYDSVTVLECVGAIEQEFDITIDLVSDDVSYSFQSVETVNSLVERKVMDNVALENADKETGRSDVAS